MRRNTEQKGLALGVNAIALEIRSAPEALLLSVVVTLSAVWATHEGILPGRSYGMSGAVAQGALWLCLYAGLAAAYAGAALKERESARQVFRKLGLGLLLAFISTSVCMHFLTPRLAPATWSDFFYLRWFVPVLLAGLWCTALLPNQTWALLRSVSGNPVTVPLPQLAVLLVSAALLVAGGDLGFQWGGSSPVAVRLKQEVIEPNSWAMTTLILFSAYAFVFSVTRRVAAALLLVSPAYVVLGLASLAKIKYLHSSVQPLDLIKIPEFLPLFRSFFGTGALVATIAALGLWIAALAAVRRLSPCETPAVRRWCTGLLSLGFLGAVPAAFFTSEAIPSVKMLLLRLGAPNTQHREQARLHGFLVSFLSQLPATFVFAPPNYSPATIASILSRYPPPPLRRSAAGEKAGQVNLIVYLVESFMDPNELGLHYTADPIPNFRAFGRTHTSGYAFVPERFSGSANTEFELLTGMTRSFLPEGSVPYRQYLRHPIPSLPRALRSLGYATTAIQADPKYYYDRERVYDLLGFERAVWLHSAPGTKPAARGAWPADQALVRAVIQASQGRRPFFAFAFPSSTHSPYHFGTYENSALDVLDLPERDAASEVKEYINALRVADQAIGTLIEYFRRQPDSTIIVVLGDHLPPLSKNALRTFLSELSSMPEAEQARLTHRVPLLIWSNFELPREAVQLSTSALPSYLLEKMGIPPSGLLAVSDVVRRTVPVLTAYAGGGGRKWSVDSLLSQERTVLEDYRLVQHDILLGRQYLLSDGGLR